LLTQRKTKLFDLALKICVIYNFWAKRQSDLFRVFLQSGSSQSLINERIPLLIFLLHMKPAKVTELQLPEVDHNNYKDGKIKELKTFLLEFYWPCF